MRKFLDLTNLEFLIFCPLIFSVVLVGLCPEVFLNSLNKSINNLIELLYF